MIGPVAPHRFPGADRDPQHAISAHSSCVVSWLLTVSIGPRESSVDNFFLETKSAKRHASLPQTSGAPCGAGAATHTRSFKRRSFVQGTVVRRGGRRDGQTTSPAPRSASVPELGWAASGCGTQAKGGQTRSLAPDACGAGFTASRTRHRALAARAADAAQARHVRRAAGGVRGGVRAVRLSPDPLLRAVESPPPDRGSAGPTKPVAWDAGASRARGQDAQQSVVPQGLGVRRPIPRPHPPHPAGGAERACLRVEQRAAARDALLAAGGSGGPGNDERRGDDECKGADTPTRW